MPRRNDFPESVKQNCLLWSDRHCCLCGTACATNIEIAHIERKLAKNLGGNDQENAIPLCYHCHAEISHYNDEEPLGNKYRPEELKARRDQIYERHTGHFVPPLLFEITNFIGGNPNARTPLPDVCFNMTHLGSYPPVRARIEARTFLGTRDMGAYPVRGYYNGETIWNLNPSLKFFGHFSIPEECMKSEGNLQIEVRVRVIDPYGREHELLPVCYRYVRGDDYWYLDPTGFDQLRRYL